MNSFEVSLKREFGPGLEFKSAVRAFHLDLRQHRTAWQLVYQRLLSLSLLAPWSCVISLPSAAMAGSGQFSWSPMSPSSATGHAFSRSATVSDFRRLSRQLTPEPSPQAWLASSKRRVGVLDPPASPLEMLSPVSRSSAMKRLEVAWLTGFSNRSLNLLTHLNGTRGCHF
jgi:hypothetical protein